LIDHYKDIIIFSQATW